MSVPDALIPATRNDPTEFRGFEPLNASFLYCPNEFFDVCLRSLSLPSLRLVSYVLRQTLGWLDSNGEPVEQDICLPYSELIKKAGISRGVVSKALREAVATRCVEYVKRGNPDEKASPGQSTSLRLCWNTHGDAATRLPEFCGFYAGEGRRSPIPNAFFAVVVPLEPLSVVRVVGCVLRHTVGYQNQFGGRRTSAPLSFSYLQRYTGIRDRTTLGKAIDTACSKGYIERVRSGCFAADKTRRRPAEYAVHWACSSEKTAHTFTNPTSQPVHQPNQSTKPTNADSATRPADQSTKPTDRKTEQKDTLKQQCDGKGIADNDCVVVAGHSALQILQDAGFDKKTASRLAEVASLEEIKHQIEWLPRRTASRNPLGMLRKAIEEAWEPPHVDSTTGEVAEVLDREERKRGRAFQEQKSIIANEIERNRQRKERLERWQNLSDSERDRLFHLAETNAKDEFTRSRLKRQRDDSSPPTEVLSLMPTPTSTSQVERRLTPISTP